MATSPTTSPTSTSKPDGDALPAGTTRRRSAAGTRPAPKPRPNPALRSASKADVEKAGVEPTGAPREAGEQPAGERLSDEERQRRIAEAAYRKAEERGFRGDRQLDDWLEAEREHHHSAR